MNDSSECIARFQSRRDTPIRGEQSVLIGCWERLGGGGVAKLPSCAVWLHVFLEESGFWSGQWAVVMLPSNVHMVSLLGCVGRDCCGEVATLKAARDQRQGRWSWVCICCS